MEWKQWHLPLKRCCEGLHMVAENSSTSSVPCGTPGKTTAPTGRNGQIQSLGTFKFKRWLCHEEKKLHLVSTKAKTHRNKTFKRKVLRNRGEQVEQDNSSRGGSSISLDLSPTQETEELKVGGKARDRRHDSPTLW